MAELLECGCVDLRDTNNKYPELLQLGRERSSGAERALPAFIVERILFFFVLLYANKVAGLLWAPLPVNKRGFLAL